MKKFLALAMMVLGQMLTMGCHSEMNQSVSQPVVITSDTVQSTPTCANPNEEIKTSCAEMAQQILSSTLRIQLRRWQKGADGWKGEYINGGVGHGTVKDGRYLVTHNHFPVPLTNVDETELIRVSVYNWRGESILEDIPLSAVSVVDSEPDLTILDFGQYGEMGLFEMLEIPSASFQSNDSLSLAAGEVVAQVDWDGNQAHVDWVLIEDVVSSKNETQVVLSNPLRKGASGGGVFLNGVHIANNLSVNRVYNHETGELIKEMSVAVLNTSNSMTQVAANLTYTN